MKFVVITKDNALSVLQAIEESGNAPVIIGFTEEDYKALERNLEEIQGTIQEWRTFAQEYQKYYEEKKAPPKKGFFGN